MLMKNFKKVKNISITKSHGNYDNLKILSILQQTGKNKNRTRLYITIYLS